MKAFLWLIGFLIALAAVLIVGAIIFENLHARYIRLKYPDYDRQLSKSEQDFVDNAGEKLRQFAADGEYKSGYYWLTYFSFVPAMAVAWGGLYLVYCAIYKIHLMLYREPAELGALVWTPEAPIGPSVVLGIFTGICLAAVLCYFVTRKSMRYNAWMILTQGGKGETEESILERRIAHIEHDVRLRKLDALSNFEPSDFLNSIARGHARNFSIVTYGLLALNGLMMLSELNARNYFHEKGINHSGYFDATYTQTLYEDLDQIDIRCSEYSDGDKNRYLLFMKNDEELVSIEVTHWNVIALLELDETLRKQPVQFRPAPRKYWPICARTKIHHDNSEKNAAARRVLHLDEFGKKP